MITADDLLGHCGLPQYVPTFKANLGKGKRKEVPVASLRAITATTLPKLGVTDFEHVKAIAWRCRTLCEERLPASPPPSPPSDLIEGLPGPASAVPTSSSVPGGPPPGAPSSRIDLRRQQRAARARGLESVQRMGTPSRHTGAADALRGSRSPSVYDELPLEHYAAPDLVGAPPDRTREAAVLAGEGPEAERVDRRDARALSHTYARSALLVTGLRDDLVRFNRLVLASFKETCRADKVVLLVVDAPEKRLLLFVDDPAAGVRDAVAFPLSADASIAGAVAVTGEPVALADAYLDKRFDKSVDGLLQYRTKQVLCVPIRSRFSDRVVAVAQLINTLDGAPFTRTDLHVAQAMAGRISEAVETKFNTLLDAHLAWAGHDAGDAFLPASDGATRPSVFDRVPQPAVDLESDEGMLAHAELEYRSSAHRGAQMSAKADPDVDEKTRRNEIRFDRYGAGAGSPTV